MIFLFLFAQMLPENTLFQAAFFSAKQAFSHIENKQSENK